VSVGTRVLLAHRCILIMMMLPALVIWSGLVHPIGKISLKSLEIHKCCMRVDIALYGKRFRLHLFVFLFLFFVQTQQRWTANEWVHIADQTHTQCQKWNHKSKCLIWSRCLLKEITDSEMPEIELVSNFSLSPWIYGL